MLGEDLVDHVGLLSQIDGVCLSPFSCSAYKHSQELSTNNIWDWRDEAMAITHLRHVGIFSPDLNKQREFYGNIWGLDQIREERDAVYFRGASPEHHLLSLHAAKRRGLHHLAFGMTKEEDVDRTARESKHNQKVEGNFIWR
jgi:catechol-2,3-dioxygenase